MPIGAHVSIAGGIWNAPERAAAIECECFQMFTRSPQGGAAPPLTDEVVEKFRAACTEHHQQLWVVHTPYYINLASELERTRQASVRVIREELERASSIGATYVMTHLGSAREVGKEQGRVLVIDGLRRILDDYTGSAQFLIEISAGAGAVIGATFEEIAEIIREVEGSSFRPKRSGAEKSQGARRSLDSARDDGVGKIGVCFDTQHAFGSGYDLRTPEAVAETMRQFDTTIGLARLKMSHFQDSKVALGDHKDRHEHIGRGHIGVDGLRAIAQHPAFRTIPLILETEDEGREEDVRLLKEFRGTIPS
ncbi:MAG: deoxyribonuclease IV [bacterium]|nr:deoxyribonuclease IV [bacterium]